METGNEQFIQKCHEFLGSAKGSRYDKSVLIYDMILESEQPKSSWEYFLENADSIDSSEKVEADAYFTAQQLKKYEKEYADLVDAILTKLVVQHLEKDEFYNQLWESVITSDLIFDKKDVKIYAMGRIWSDMRIPYFYLEDGIKMSNEEFADIIENNRKLLQEINFILGCKYDQRTEFSSRLLNVLNKCRDDKEKAVVMAKIVDGIERRTVLNMLNSQNG